MTDFRVSLLLTVALLSPARCTASPLSGPIVPGHSVAGIELGMESSRVRELLGNPKKEEGESWHYPQLHLTVSLHDKSVNGLMFVKACQGQEPFRDSMTWAESIKTAEGIGLGSSTEEIKRALGAPEHERHVEATVEMDVLSYPSHGIMFQVGESGTCVIGITAPYIPKAAKAPAK